MDDDNESCHVYVWHEDGHVMDHNMYTGDNEKVIKVAQPDESQVTCAIAFHGIHMICRSVSHPVLEIYF